MERAKIGHNNPPTEIEILQQRLADYKTEAATLAKLDSRKMPTEITDDVLAGELSDHVRAVQILEDRIGDIHKKEKQPFWDAGKAADKWKNDYLAKIAVIRAKATPLLLAWNKKKEKEERDRQLEIARKAREDADALLQEAAAHEAEGIHDTAQELVAAAVQDEQKANMIQNSALHVKAKSLGGFSSSGIKRSWAVQIESLAALDLEIVRKYITEDEALKILNRAVKDGVREVRGTKIFEEENLSVRGRG